VAWLLPELELGVEPELKPLELELEFEFEFEEPEFELVDDPELELELVPLLEEDPELGDEPVDVEEEVAVVCVDPGRARTTAPAATTLAMVTAVVVERILARPRSRAAIARRTLSRSALLMSPILRSRIRSLLHEASRLAMRDDRSRGEPPGPRLASEHEGLLKPRFSSPSGAG
jgi:hypothetical protein